MSRDLSCCRWLCELLYTPGAHLVNCSEFARRDSIADGKNYKAGKSTNWSFYFWSIWAGRRLSGSYCGYMYDYLLSHHHYCSWDMGTLNGNPCEYDLKAPGILCSTCFDSRCGRRRQILLEMFCLLDSMNTASYQPI